MKLNLGCGYGKLPDHVNVDRFATCEPDLVFNLESAPWPWQDSSVSEVVFKHSLEHMGATTDAFLDLIKELYRVCHNGAIITIIVPHPRHDNFLDDPTHVRVITPRMLGLFSKRNNDFWQKHGHSNTPLAHYLSVDFEVTSIEFHLDEPYASMDIPEQELKSLIKEKNNVVNEMAIQLRVIKDVLPEKKKRKPKKTAAA